MDLARVNVMGDAKEGDGDGDELAIFWGVEDEVGGRSAVKGGNDDDDEESSLLSKEVTMVAAVSMDSSTCPRKRWRLSSSVSSSSLPLPWLA